MYTPTTIDLIRHGEPVGGSRYRGQRDDPLSELGWAQMRAAVGDHAPWHTIISSTLSRCAAFGHELAARHHLPLELEPRLMEIGQGAWEGLTVAEIEAQWPGALARFQADPVGLTPPDGERLEAFSRRVLSAWDALLTRHAGRHVLVVGHAGVIRMIVREVLAMPLAKMYRIQVPNAGITRLRIEQRAGEMFPTLLFHAGVL